MATDSPNPEAEGAGAGETHTIKSDPSKRLRFPLLAQLVVALVLMGLLPFAVSFFQLQRQAQVVETQAKDSHHLATRTAVQRLQSFVDTFVGVARAMAEHPAVLAGRRDEALGNALTGTVSSVPGVLAVGLFTPRAETVALAQRLPIAERIGSVFGEVDDESGSESGEPGSASEAEVPKNGAPTLEVLKGSSGERYLRVRYPLSTGQGFLVLIADAQPMESLIDPPTLGSSFETLLIDRNRSVLVGGTDQDLERFPEEVFASELDKAGSWSRIFRKPDENGRPTDMVVGRADLQNAPWTVISRQSASEAERAKAEMKRVRLLALGLALLLTLLISSFAFATVIRPLRRLVAAQAALTGRPAEAGISEIAQLEASFQALQQRIKDKQELGDIFLGRYQITDLVGSGAMGSVFRGWDPKLQRAVALKTIHVDTEEVDQSKLLGSLRDEAAISARIHQPNIVTVYDIEDRGSTAFIAMEYVEGVNLQGLLRKRTRLTAAQVIPLGAALARGLAAAHSNYLVHHDVKPANLLLGFDGSIKLTDFGVSLSLTAASQKSDVICGTPGYLAPECFEGEGYTPGSDVWALGVVMWECVAGYNPFRGGSLRATLGRTMTVHPEPLVDLYPDVPEAFSNLVNRLLLKDPSQRPADAQEVAAELEQLCRGLDLQWIPDFSDLMIVDEKEKPASSKDAPTIWVPKAGASSEAEDEAGAGTRNVKG